MLYCEILATVGPLSLTQIHIWQQHLFHRNFLASSRKQETILCRNIVPEENGRLQLDVMPTQGFYDKGKLLVYDKVAKSAEARQQLSKCGNSLDIEEEAIEKLFEFTCLVIYGDKVSIGPWEQLELQSGRQ